MNHVVATIKKQLAAARDNPEEPSRVFVISTYVIGKERILLAVRRLHPVAVQRAFCSGGREVSVQQNWQHIGCAIRHHLCCTQPVQRRSSRDAPPARRTDARACNQNNAAENAMADAHYS